MNGYRIGLSCVVLAMVAALPACAPSVGGGEEEDGKAIQAAEDGEGADGEEANDPKSGEPVSECGDDGSPTGSTPACTGIAIGDGQACIAPGDAKQLADDACQEQGLLLTELWPLFDCADQGSTYAKVLCCGTSGGPPSDPGPVGSGVVGDGQACTANSDLMLLADAACAADGMVLADFYAADECSPGVSLWAKYVCAP